MRRRRARKGVAGDPDVDALVGVAAPVSSALRVGLANQTFAGGPVPSPVARAYTGGCR